MDATCIPIRQNRQNLSAIKIVIDEYLFISPQFAYKYAHGVIECDEDNYLCVFEYLKPFSRIIVTGPQRSGTTICANMIAKDLGLNYVDEVQGLLFHPRLIRKSVFKTLERRNNIVFQAPSAASFCHLLPPEVAVVYMIRPIEEILLSQKRVRWNRWNQFELDIMGERSGNSCEIKYQKWPSQKRLIRHAFEVEYHSLADHRMWVPPELRKNFHSKQIRVRRL